MMEDNMGEKKEMSEGAFIGFVGLTYKLFPLAVFEDFYILSSLYDPTLREKRKKFYERDMVLFKKMGGAADDEDKYYEAQEEWLRHERTYPWPDVKKSFDEIYQGGPDGIEESILRERLRAFVDRDVVKKEGDSYRLSPLINDFVGGYLLIRAYLAVNEKPEDLPQKAYDILVDTLRPPDIVHSGR